MIDIEEVTTADTKIKRRTAEGDIEVCCHLINFYYDIGDYELRDDDLQVLEDEAEDRAKSEIVEGYHSGELCCIIIHHNTEPEEIELHGWWSIAKA